MNWANSATSKRLRKVLDVLTTAGGKGATSFEIARATGSVAPATDVSELRRSGYVIECVYEGKTPAGRKIFRYTLLGRIAA